MMMLTRGFGHGTNESGAISGAWTKPAPVEGTNRRERVSLRATRRVSAAAPSSRRIDKAIPA